MSCAGDLLGAGHAVLDQFLGHILGHVCARMPTRRESSSVDDQRHVVEGAELPVVSASEGAKERAVEATDLPGRYREPIHCHLRRTPDAADTSDSGLTGAQELLSRLGRDGS